MRPGTRIGTSSVSPWGLGTGLTSIDSDNAKAAVSTNGKGQRRLIGWKAIGQFLGCTGRTARRWESERALPVHRVPGVGRSSVWADPEELTTWLRALPREVQADLRAEVGDVPGPAALAAVLLPAAAATAATAVPAPSPAPPQPPAADEP